MLVREPNVVDRLHFADSGATLTGIDPRLLSRHRNRSGSTPDAEEFQPPAADVPEEGEEEFTLDVIYVHVPVDSIATTSWPRERQEQEAELRRGVMAVRHRREVIFSEELVLRTEELPRLRPRIRIDPCRLPEPEHE